MPTKTDKTDNLKAKLRPAIPMAKKRFHWFSQARDFRKAWRPGPF